MSGLVARCLATDPAVSSGPGDGCGVGQGLGGGCGSCRWERVAVLVVGLYAPIASAFAGRGEGDGGDDVAVGLATGTLTVPSVMVMPRSPATFSAYRVVETGPPSVLVVVQAGCHRSL